MKPYKAIPRSGDYWVVIDTRTDSVASYPTNKRNSQAEARVLNQAYAEAIGETK